MEPSIHEGASEVRLSRALVGDDGVLSVGLQRDLEAVVTPVGIACAVALVVVKLRGLKATFRRAPLTAGATHAP